MPSPSERTCRIAGCTKPTQVKHQICSMHRTRMARHGSYEDPNPTFFDRVMSKIDAGDCWMWTGAPNASGYGTVRYGTTNRMAHRVVWELLVGPIGGDLQLDHLCRVRLCVNPDHLEPVTLAENVRRGILGHRHPGRRRTHCVNGHEFSPENTRWEGRFRKCITCRNDGQRRRYHAAKTGAHA